MESTTNDERRNREAETGELDVVDELHWGTLRDWAQLVRLPNSFTLISDTVAAALVVGSYLLPVPAFVLTLLASFCAYWAGMILNDIVDLEDDREFRPTRPLPAGRISPVIAGHIANGMLLIGPVLILAATNFHTSNSLWMGAAFASAVALSLTVRAYNSSLKHTLLGPLLMGTCRALNILMVGCTMFSVGSGEVLPQALLWFAGAIGLYIVGVTVYARREEKDSNPAGLIVGLVISGVSHPVPRKVQLAVRHAILTLILIDAAVAVMWAGPWFGAAVALMLLPALASAIRFRST